MALDHGSSLQISGARNKWIVVILRHVLIPLDRPRADRARSIYDHRRTMLTGLTD